jgi:hypothetical protein
VVWLLLLAVDVGVSGAVPWVVWVGVVWVVFWVVFWVVVGVLLLVGLVMVLNHFVVEVLVVGAMPSDADALTTGCGV